MAIQITGQAETKDNQWLYTWFEDGTVMRQQLKHFGQSEIVGRWEPVVPPIPHNNRDFWTLSGEAKLKNETGLE